jgi:TPR repeat protein/serine/threonine protein kinase
LPVDLIALESPDLTFRGNRHQNKNYQYTKPHLVYLSIDLQPRFPRHMPIEHLPFIFISHFMAEEDIPDDQNLSTNLNWAAHVVNGSDYVQERLLGAGRFGEVWLCHLKSSPNEKYALRKIRQENADAKTTEIKDPNGFAVRTETCFLREVEVYVKIRPHPAICEFVGFSMAHPAFIITEYLPNGTLADILEKQAKGTPSPMWTDTLRAKTIFGFASAMMHLRAYNAIHRYLTPRNILFNAIWEPKLADFAFARSSFDQTTASDIATANDTEYRSPEAIKNDAYSFPVDVYAFGMIVFRIATGLPLFPRLMTFRLQQAIIDGDRPKFPTTLCPLLREMIDQCWSPGETLRPTFFDIVRKLIEYEEPLFPDVDMVAYRGYREHICFDSYIPPEFRGIFTREIVCREDIPAFQAAKADADRGNKRAQALVARMYENGRGTPVDLAESFKYYEMAARSGDRVAHYHVGLAYMRGRGVLQSHERAASHIEVAAQDAAFLPAHLMLAKLCMKRVRLTTTREAIVASLHVAADPPSSSGHAQYYLARMYKFAEDNARARGYFEAALKSGYPEAAAELGTMLLKGGSADDFRRAVRIFEQAADRSATRAARNLGLLYADMFPDVRTPMDFIDREKAKKYWMQAADLGDVTAMVKLAGQFFKDGQAEIKAPGGGPKNAESNKNLVEAAKWFKRAGDAGSLIGMHNYGKMRGAGEGGPQDMKIAMDCLIQVAEAGLAQAYRTIAEFVSKGSGGLQVNAELAQGLCDRADELDRIKAG